jgi:hypothetical protein
MKTNLVLWLAGSGIDQNTTDAIVNDSRVQWELTQKPIDALGLYEATQSAATKHGENAFPGDYARTKLEFLTLFSRC